MAYAIVGNESLIIDMYPTAPKGAGLGRVTPQLGSRAQTCRVPRRDPLLAVSPLSGRVSSHKVSPWISGWAEMGISVEVSGFGKRWVGARVVFVARTASRVLHQKAVVWRRCNVLRVCVRVRHFSPQSHLGGPSNSPGDSTR